uniref:NADH-ubiquinone oxidoreductase chain 4 n=1 Tax=Obama sp. MAP-2014 TaxID=1520506 RepID=A0A0E3UVH3_9PLAT|nr:NADH dehydrogenase subunit 4 [Obama sp. MAP-2014]
MLSAVFLLVFSLFFNNIVFIINSLVFCFIYYFLVYNYSFNSFFNFKNSLFFMDSLSFYLIFLSFFLFIFIIILSINNSNNYYNLFNLLLLLILILCFLSNSTFYFFIFFEISFIFIFLIIMFWGINPERIDSLNYLIIYSLIGTIPLLFTLINFQSNVDLGSGNWLVMDYFNSLSLIDLNMQQVESFDFNKNENSLFNIFFGNVLSFFLIFLSFLIKFPVYGLHLWLPKAHVESPVYGSMILAGIMLKIGVFGIYRYLFHMKGFYFNQILVIYIICFFCFSLIFVNMVCVRQYDVKSFIAYSSIVHMTLIAIIILSNSSVSILGSIYLCISHGFCSSALFLNFNIFYLNSGTRNILINRGFIFVIPLISFFWFSFCSLNCSVPFSLNFISELLLICSGVNLSNSFLIFYLFNVFFCGLYSIFIYLFISHGKFNNSIILQNLSISNYFIFIVLLFHFYLVFFYIFFFDTYLSII